MAQKIFVNDIGTVFRATIRDNAGVIVPLADATLEACFMKPSGVALEVTPEIETDGSDGVIIYASVAGDLSEHGRYTYQVLVTLPNGAWHTDIQKFRVYRNNCG